MSTTAFFKYEKSLYFIVLYSRFLVTEEVGRSFRRLADSLAKGIIHAAEQNPKDAAKVGVALAATGAAAHLAIDYTNSESEKVRIIQSRMAEAKELFGIDIVKASPQIRAAMADFQCSITEAETSTTSFYGLKSLRLFHL